MDELSDWDEEELDREVKRLMEAERADEDRVRVNAAAARMPTRPPGCEECRRLHRVLDRERREMLELKGRHKRLERFVGLHPSVMLAALAGLPV